MREIPEKGLSSRSTKNVFCSLILKGRCPPKGTFLKTKFFTTLAPQIVFMLLACSSPAMAWNSVFLAPSGPNWVAQSVTLSGRVFKLDDYSYCGYKLSTVGVADSIPCNHVTVGSSGDVTTALRNAVANLKTL